VFGTIIRWRPAFGDRKGYGVVRPKIGLTSHKCRFK
jgi:hypothetical protein